MENLQTNVISILNYLLPGFLTAWIFYRLTSFKRPSQFERVIQALVFTIFVNLFVTLTKIFLLWIGKFFDIGTWTTETNYIYSVLFAIFTGFLFSYVSNSDKVHSILRKLNITKETSYPSEWYGTFAKNITYIVLHLDGERRIYGWPREWPSDPKNGHFVLEVASWLVGKKQIELTNVKYIMIDSKDVKMVEFMHKTWENN